MEFVRGATEWDNAHDLLRQVTPSTPLLGLSQGEITSTMLRVKENILVNHNRGFCT